MHVAASALLVAVGILLMIWDYELILAVRYMVGGGLIVAGLSKVFGYFANDLYRLAFQFDLAFGLLTAILGLFVLFTQFKNPTFLVGVVVLFLLIDGLLKLQISVDARRFGMKRWALLMVSAGLVVVLSGLLFYALLDSRILNPVKTVGLALIVDGAENIWNTMYTVRVRARKKNATEMLDRLDSASGKRKDDANGTKE